MHVTAVSKQEVEELRRAFAVYDVDNDGRIDVYEFSLVLRSIFEDDPMFCSLLSGVIQECKKKKWVYFPDFLGTLVRNKGNPFYEEIWDRFTFLATSFGDLHLQEIINSQGKHVTFTREPSSVCSVEISPMQR